MPDDLVRRRSLFTAALGFALLDTRGQPAPPEVQTVRKWLDNWPGPATIVTGMQRQDYDLELARGTTAVAGAPRSSWTGMEHSLTNATGTAWEPTPWRAVQVAAWEALGKIPGEPHEPTPAEDVILP
jgi:hypothetical protein